MIGVIERGMGTGVAPAVHAACRTCSLLLLDSELSPLKWLSTAHPAICSDSSNGDDGKHMSDKKQHLDLLSSFSMRDKNTEHRSVASGFACVANVDVKPKYSQLVLCSRAKMKEEG